MATIIPNEFTSYDLDESEQLEGSVLTTTQKQVLQNQLSICAAELLALEYDTAEPQSYIQQEAYKRGQIEQIRFILASSDAAQEALYPISSINTQNLQSE
jgi:hypothetical protein